MYTFFIRFDDDKFDPFLLSRGTVGRDTNTFISTWHVRQTYRFKVMAAKNINVLETMKVHVHVYQCLYVYDICVYECTCTCTCISVSVIFVCMKVHVHVHVYQCL